MSKAIDTMFQRSLEQSLREEKCHADKWKQETQLLPIAHLLCNCGKPLKDKLLSGLLTAAFRSFEAFMFEFFDKNPSTGYEEIETIKQKATWQKIHPSVILLNHLIESQQSFTVGDIIDSLEKACLYRVIASFDSRSMCGLKDHVLTHKNKGCCLVNQKYGFSPVVPRPLGTNGLHVSNKSSSNARRVAKTCRGIVLLTFQEDGRQHAIEVKETLEKPSGEGQLPYIVYTLSNFKKYIEEDFAKNILIILSQVDFIVPILTDDYFRMLVDETQARGNGFDEIYAPYVAKILQANWASSFKNKRMRSYKPRNVQWPSKLVCPPFLTAITEPSALPSILIKSKD